jgi:hypothetical protein
VRTSVSEALGSAVATAPADVAAMLAAGDGEASDRPRVESFLRGVSPSR